jgi:hypothetical protein
MARHYTPGWLRLDVTFNLPTRRELSSNAPSPVNPQGLKYRIPRFRSAPHSIFAVERRAPRRFHNCSARQRTQELFSLPGGRRAGFLRRIPFHRRTIGLERVCGGVFFAGVVTRRPAGGAKTGRTLFYLRLRFRPQDRDPSPLPSEEPVSVARPWGRNKDITLM